MPDSAALRRVWPRQENGKGNGAGPGRQTPARRGFPVKCRVCSENGARQGGLSDWRGPVKAKIGKPRANRNSVSEAALANILQILS